MKLDMNMGALKDKQTVVAIALIAVILLAVGWVVYSNFIAEPGGGEESPAPQVSGAVPGGGANPAPGGPGGPPPGANPSAAPPGPATGQAPPPGAPAGGTPPPGAATPPTSQPRAAAPSAPPPTASAAPTAVKAGASKSATKTITVFGTVTVAYPNGWGIDLRSAGSAAVLTDGKGRFEIHAPDPRSGNAKAIADSTFVTVAQGGKVTGQGALKIAGFDAYQYAVNTPAGPIRIVGVDSPTRIAIVERVKSGALGAYKAAFDKMESGLQFR